jgi:hypothetical protein
MQMGLGMSPQGMTRPVYSRISTNPIGPVNPTNMEMKPGMSLLVMKEVIKIKDPIPPLTGRRFVDSIISPPLTSGEVVGITLPQR